MDHALRLPPIRSMREFIGGKEWSPPTLNVNEFAQLHEQVISNLIYYQSNYGAFLIPFIFLVAYFRPTAILLGLFVIALLLAAFVYSTRQHLAFTHLLHGRPIVILVSLLILSFLIIRMFGMVFIFLFGIALPVGLVVAHAVARQPTMKSRAEVTVESLSLQATPMGILLTWLGAKESSPVTTTTKSE